MKQEGIGGYHVKKKEHKLKAITISQIVVKEMEQIQVQPCNSEKWSLQYASRYHNMKLIQLTVTRLV